MNQHIMLVTFPRSGHHLLVALVNDYAKLQNLPFSYCEFYGCHTKQGEDKNIHKICTQNNCSDTCCVLTKNHDFGLNPYCPVPEWTDPVTINANKRYIILYRQDPVKQFEAWYRHFKACNTPPNIKYDARKETYNDFVENFYVYNIDYYDAFIKKWVTSKNKNVYAFTYESLVENTMIQLTSILNIIYPYHNVNVVNLRNVIQKNDVGYKNTITKEVYEKVKTLMDSV